MCPLNASSIHPGQGQLGNLYSPSQGQRSDDCEGGRFQGEAVPITGASSTGAGVAFVPAFRSLLDSAGLGAVPLLPGSNGLPAPLGTTTIPGLDGTGVTLIVPNPWG